MDSPCYHLIKNQKNWNIFGPEITSDTQDIETKLSQFQPSLVLYSTGWQNHLEYHFRPCKNASYFEYCFLNHWTNYRERFGYPQKNWEDNLPSFIAAHDQTSYDKAKAFGLPNVVAIKNYALLAQLKEAQDALSMIQKKNTLLFLSEPTAKIATRSFGDPYGWGFTEKEVFRDILEHSSLLNVTLF